MDAKRFDTIVRSLTVTGSRRGVLGVLTTLPLLGGLFTLHDPAETDARGRRKKAPSRGEPAAEKKKRKKVQVEGGGLRRQVRRHPLQMQEAQADGRLRTVWMRSGL